MCCWTPQSSQCIAGCLQLRFTGHPPSLRAIGADELDHDLQRHIDGLDIRDILGHLTGQASQAVTGDDTAS
jgi:hypothetical protein